jgi:hypothetical protein
MLISPCVLQALTHTQVRSTWWTEGCVNWGNAIFNDASRFLSAGSYSCLSEAGCKQKAARVRVDQARQHIRAAHVSRVWRRT